jgi:hypothetical protein
MKQAAPRRTQSVQVTELAVVSDPSSIPPELSQFFAGRGLRLQLVCALPRELYRRARFQSTPVTIQDVPEKDQEYVQGLVQAGGFRVVNGNYMRGDTVLCKQPLAQWKALGMDAFNRWSEQRPNVNKDAEELRDKIGGDIRHGVTIITDINREPNPANFETTTEY